MKKLIIFDCDGTLVDSEIIAAEVFPAVWASMGYSISSDEFISNFVGTGSDAEIVKTTMALLPANAMEVSLEKYMIEMEKSLQPVRGVTGLLANLTHEACVASNSPPDYLQKVLRITHLSPFFGARVYSAYQVPKKKPAPDVFLHAAQVLGFSPEDCVVIEDSVPGIQAAQAAGMKVIGFMGGLHFNDVIRKKLFSAQADEYCQTAQELEQSLLRMLS